MAVILAVGLVAGLAYGLQYAPVIYSDDWSHIVGQYVYGTMQWLDWADRRPLLDAPLVVLTGLFGLNISALHLVLVALHVLAALQFYWLLRRIGAGPRSFALVVSLLFLVYPADYSHTWLTMIGIWVAANLLFAYAHLLLTYVVTGAVWLLVVSCCVLLASLGIYEAQLGLALAWTVLLPLIRRDAPRVRKIALLAPVTIGLLFVAWRTLGMSAAGVTDPYVQHIQMSPSLLLYRVWFGVGILVWSWGVTLREALHLDSKLVLTALVALAVALFALIGFVLARKFRGDAQPLTTAEWRGQMRKALTLLGLGCVLAVAGFIPIISVYLPNLTGVGSRFNLFALPGASLAVAALLWSIALLLARKERQIELIMVISALPLLFIGIWTQAWVQHDARISWQEQKQIWADLTPLVPNLVDDTAVYFVLPGYGVQPTIHNWHRTPLTAEWEVSSALEVLYDNPTLRGDRVFLNGGPRFGNPELRPEGIVDYWTSETVPYERAIFVAFDGPPGTARIVEDLRTELSLEWTPAGYAPRSRITAPPVDGFTNRWLVDQPALPVKSP